MSLSTYAETRSNQEGSLNQSRQYSPAFANTLNETIESCQCNTTASLVSHYDATSTAVAKGCARAVKSLVKALVRFDKRLNWSLKALVLQGDTSVDGQI